MLPDLVSFLQFFVTSNDFEFLNKVELVVYRSSTGRGYNIPIKTHMVGESVLLVWPSNYSY
jgi:hypothetical protein